jgi:hypothetical protein
MEQDALLEQLKVLLDNYAAHQAFMAKATEQIGKFKAEVIEKVIADHQIKASLIADDVEPLTPQLQAAVAEIDAGIAECEASKGNLGEALEEMQLRYAIGELSDADFEEQSRDGRSTVESADGRIEELNADREKLQSALDRWAELSGLEVSLPPAPPPVPQIPVAGIGEVDESVEFDESVAVEDDSDIGFDFDDGEAKVDIAESPGAEEVDVELDDGPVAAVEEEDSSEDDDGAISVSAGASADASAEVDMGDDARRALLMYQEGTPEEQIYPFTGEVLTVGRGRDNDIQIKNDSKVSRFHCKLFRRGHNFYVEDNKSSNGTLINGELVTERRLFGGEEIIIGETYFRFRIV